MSNLSPPQRKALERLITIALTETGQSEAVANFLLCWHNPAENGGWNPCDLWRLDEAIVSDVFTILQAIQQCRCYPAELGYSSQMEAIWRQST